MVRAIQSFPKQGSKPPWRLHQNYALDILTIRRAPMEDGVLEWGPRRLATAPADDATVAAAA